MKNTIFNLYFSYESHTENEFTYDGLRFIPLYNFLTFSNNKIIMFLKSLTIPFKIRNIINDVDIFTNTKFWFLDPLILKVITKKPVLTRTGYDATNFL